MTFDTIVNGAWRHDARAKRATISPARRNEMVISGSLDETPTQDTFEESIEAQ